MSAPPGKRKKTVNKCPNPLFIQWLTEWRDEAAELGIKSKYQYQKALATLKKYPLQLTNGKEAKVLENFGDKICKRLDDKLAEYIAEYGTTEPVPGIITVNLGKGGGRSKHPSTAPSAFDFNALTIPTPPAPGCISLDSDNDNDHNDRPYVRPRQRNPSGRRPSGSREYRPQQGSGPFALIVTLYDDLQNPVSRGFMSKPDLMEAAQPLCNKSFTLPDPGCRYTAWSSMGTLIKKGYVIKESSPAKYSLTNVGCELAYKLIHDTRDENVHPVPRPDPIGTLLGDRGVPSANVLIGPTVNPGTSGVLGAIESVMSRAGSPAKRATYICSPSSTRQRNFSGFGNVVESEIDEHALERNSPCKFPGSGNRLGSALPGNVASPHAERFAGVGQRLGGSPKAAMGRNATHSVSRISAAAGAPGNVHTISSSEDDDDELPDLSERLFGKPTSSTCGNVASSGISNLGSSSSDQNVSLEESNNRLKFVYISDSGATVRSKDEAAVLMDEELSVGFLVKCKYENLLMCAKRYKLDTSRAGDGDYIFAYLHNDDTPDEANPETDGMMGAKPKPVASHKQPSTFQTKRKEKAVLSTEPAKAFPLKTPAYSAPIYAAGQQELSEIQSSQGSTVSSIASLPEPDFSLAPGMFDIILCIDNQEHYGGSKISKGVLLPELNKCGIKYDVRKLSVGDFLWVARERNFAAGNPRELVLDYIVERKRMDDLSGSIVDGRFREQKFRMHACGLTHAIYLVEKYGSSQHFSIAENSLNQAIANTQVVDQFYVKHTQGMKESVAYLAVMTKYMKSLYSTKSLIAVKKSTLEEAKIINNQNNMEQHLMTFLEFNQGSMKTKALTVREMFGKQLLQMHGMTAEKACAILEVYPTPSCLLQGYYGCLSMQQKENLLADIKFGPGVLKRKIGVALSKSLSLIYTADKITNM